MLARFCCALRVIAYTVAELASCSGRNVSRIAISRPSGVRTETQWLPLIVRCPRT